MSLHVLFKVGGVDYALPAKDVLHLESYSPPTKVPGAPDHVAGLLQIRRRVVPVVDLRARFGLPKAEPTLDSRVVVVQAGQTLSEIAVRELPDLPMGTAGAEIQIANKLNTSHVHAGQQLVIPAE